jgi:hypothetical protein
MSPDTGHHENRSQARLELQIRPGKEPLQVTSRVAMEPCFWPHTKLSVAEPKDERVERRCFPASFSLILPPPESQLLIAADAGYSTKLE